jgi:hypothetical protein
MFPFFLLSDALSRYIVPLFDARRVGDLLPSETKYLKSVFPSRPLPAGELAANTLNNKCAGIIGSWREGME